MKKTLLLIPLLTLQPLLPTNQHNIITQCLGTTTLLLTQLTNLKDKENYRNNIQTLKRLKQQFQTQLHTTHAQPHHPAQASPHYIKGWSTRRINKYTGTIYDIHGYTIYGWSQAVNKLTERQLIIRILHHQQKALKLKKHLPSTPIDLIHQFIQHPKWTLHHFNQDTHTKYDENGYNIHGFKQNGYNKNGYNHWGLNKEGLDPYGYDPYGYNKEGWSKNSINEYTGTQYNQNGFDINGWHKQGWHKDTKGRYDPDGYDRDGFNPYGYNEEGYDENGYNKYGYNMYGYDEDGH